MQVDLTDDEYAAVQQLGTEHAEERRRHQPFSDTYAKLVEQLASEGVTIGDARFCWLRFKSHNYRGHYHTGTPAHGASWTVCVDCGHHRRIGNYGSAGLGPR